MKKAKIIATIGPSSESEKILLSMIKAGIDVARLNFSHSTQEKHLKNFKRIRKMSLIAERPVAVLQDLQGIKIRVSDVKEGAIVLKKGQKILLKSGTSLTYEGVIYITYPNLLKDIKPGHRMLFDDGLIEVEVKKRTKEALEAVVKEGGILKSKKGVNLPDSKISLSPFTDKDRDDLDFGLKIGVDYVALSFVMTAREIKNVKQYIVSRGASVPIIAKIEKPEALNHIDDILDESDGIMIARGDLGVEIPTEEVPLVQKELIRKANARGKLVIVATQMLESMKKHTRPTRAEATDVSNAVIDGTDVLMLSVETSTGLYPVQSVRMMRRIIKSTERHTLRNRLHIKELKGYFHHTKDLISFATADSAVRAAEDVGAKCIVAFTSSGFTAQLVSKCRPHVPIIAFTPHERVYRIMSLYWGVRPFVMRKLEGIEEMLLEVESFLINKRIARKGDVVVVVAGSPLMVHGKTNFMKIHVIGKE